MRGISNINHWPLRSALFPFADKKRVWYLCSQMHQPQNTWFWLLSNDWKTSYCHVLWSLAFVIPAAAWGFKLPAVFHPASAVWHSLTSWWCCHVHLSLFACVWRSSPGRWMLTNSMCDCFDTRVSGLLGCSCFSDPLPGCSLSFFITALLHSCCDLVRIFSKKQLKGSSPSLSFHLQLSASPVSV